MEAILASNQNANIIFSLLSQEAFLILNKVIARKIGLKEAIILADIVGKYKYFSDKNQLDGQGFFFNSAENIESDTTIKRRTQFRAITQLEKLGLIFTRVKGQPPIKYFKPNMDGIAGLFIDNGSCQLGKNGTIKCANNDDLNEPKRPTNINKKNKDKSKKKSAAKPPSVSPYKTFIDAYYQAFKARFKRNPAFNAVEGKAAKNMLAAVPLGDLLTALKRYMVSNDKFYIKQGFTLRFMQGQLNALLIANGKTWEPGPSSGGAQFKHSDEDILNQGG